MLKNVTHKSFYEDQKRELEESKLKNVEQSNIVSEVAKVEEVQPVKFDAEYYFGLTKEEQIKLLKELGLSSKEIRALKTEDSRVKKLLSFGCQ